MHSDGYTASPGVAIVTRERNLPLFIQLPIGIERERMRGDNDPLSQNILNNGS
jgi:hypothetical protein